MSDPRPPHLAVGEAAPPFRLPLIDGTVLLSTELLGAPYLLAFLRFASCPFCNLRVAELVRRHDELPEGFRIVAVFDSSLENLQRHAERHAAPFSILADSSGETYAAYRIERSVAGMLKGMTLRLPTLVKGLARGYLPIRPRGSMLTMPADLLIDADGVIRTAYYGRDEGDHLPWDDIVAFAREALSGDAR